MNAQELKHGLAHYTGCEQPYRHGLNRAVLYTDGVRFFAQNAGGGAYWLLDILATEPDVLRQAQDEGFASVTLTVEGSKAVLVVTDGNDTVVYERKIDYTDCPEGEWKFFFVGNMILLLSEY